MPNWACNCQETKMNRRWSRMVPAWTFANYFRSVWETFIRFYSTFETINAYHKNLKEWADTSFSTIQSTHLMNLFSYISNFKNLYFKVNIRAHSRNILYSAFSFIISKTVFQKCYLLRLNLILPFLETVSNRYLSIMWEWILLKIIFVRIPMIISFR